jgi:tetratricopeptide (TPR) repeat protein
VKFASEPLTEAELRMVLGGAIGAAGDIQTALSQFQRAFELRQRELGLWHSDTLWSLSWVAQAESHINGSTTVKNLVEQTAKKIRSSRHPWSSGEAEIVCTYGVEILWRAEHRPKEALPYLSEAIAVSRRLSDPKDYRLQNKLDALPRLLEEAGDLKESEKLWKENIAQGEKLFGTNHFLVAQFQRGYAGFLKRRGRPSEALPVMASAVPTYQRVLGTNNADARSAKWLLEEIILAAEKARRTNEPSAEGAADTPLPSRIIPK